MRAMSFNLRFATADDGENSWPFRKDLVIEVIQRHAPGLIGVQEAQKEQVDYLDQMLDDYLYIGVGRDDGRDAGEFSAIFYNRNAYTCLRQETFWLSETPEVVGGKGWDANNIRICTWGRFLDNETGASFLFFNTHFDHVGQEAQMESAKLLLQKIERNADGQSVLLSGDFNCTPNSPPYFTLTGVGASMQALRLADARMLSESPPSGPDWTFHGFHPPGQIIIDYIFVHNVTAVESFHTLDDHWQGRYPSDHLPIMADVVVKSGRP